MVRKSRTEEGETIPHHLFAIGFGTDLDGSQDFFQMYWPMVLSHRFVSQSQLMLAWSPNIISIRIDESSPLWSLAPSDLRTEHFEIILTLEGIVPETGNNIQVDAIFQGLSLWFC